MMIKHTLLTAAALVGFSAAALAQTYTGLHHCNASGCTFKSGSSITMESGATLTVDGVTIDESTLAMSSLTASAAELNYNDIATLGTLAASKAWTSDSSLDTVMPTGGLLTVSSGGAVTMASGSTLTVGGTAVTGGPALTNNGRDWFNICGDAVTISSNTVYYGPNVTLLASSGNGQTCDIDAAGNVTEATADAPIYTNQAFQVLGMTCRNEGDANADIIFALRTAAGATTPSVTCTIADGERDCVADVQTTTAIAAGATVAIAATDADTNVGADTGFVCTISVAY